MNTKQYIYIYICFYASPKYAGNGIAITCSTGIWTETSTHTHTDVPSD